MKKVWKKIKLAMREALNLLTNLLCPVVSAVCVVLEVCQCPASMVSAVKKVEYWFWKIGGTKDAIEDLIGKVDGAIDKTEEEHDKLTKGE